MWGGLRDDPVIWLSGLVYALVVLPFLAPILDPDRLAAFSDNYAPAVLIVVTLVALLSRIAPARSRDERRFWLGIAAAHGAWLAVRVLYVLVPEQTVALQLTADGLILLYYASLLVAISFRPHLAARGRAAGIGRQIELLGSLLFALSLLVYFVLIPAKQGESVYLSAWTSFSMYGVFDLVLLASFATLWSARDLAPRWRSIYGLMLVNVTTWALLDFTEGAMEVEFIPWVDSGTALDILWFLPYAPVILAARIGAPNWPMTAGRAAAATDEGLQEDAWGMGRLVAFAMTLPAVHLTLSAFGWMQYGASRELAFCTVATLLVLGALAFVQQRISARQRLRAVEDLARSEEKLRRSQKLEAIGTLTSGIAHDFNNLLGGIDGFTKLAIEQLPDDSPAVDDLRQVLETSGRAADLTGRLLLFSRRETPHLDVVGINDLLANTSELLRQLLAENIEQELRTDPTLGHVRADPIQIEQVIVNLALNARDAMPEGGKLLIEASTVEVGGSGRRADDQMPGRYVRVSVSDTGHGMSQQVRERIFDPFFSTKEADKGTGLGLSICYGIVEAHGGRFDVSSVPGEGTTVSFLLPSVEPPEPVAV